MGDTDGAITMIKLDSTNYSIWKSNMKICYISKIFMILLRNMMLNQQIDLKIN